MFDLAIAGSGFAGSLLAMIARRLGLSVLLLEREKHPRFAIGESSTPLANLLLEELSRRYDLAAVLPLSKWGTWQRECPEIACGLKRGFSFFHHELGRKWSNNPERDNQLLVAASPNERIADTHWYRAEFDEYLARKAQDLGVVFVDEVDLDEPSISQNGVCLKGKRHGRTVEYSARFLVDATGPRGFLHRTLSLREAPMPHLPETEALYAHFENVHPFAQQFAPDFHSAPYPIDDAAVHHVFDNGWIWVLRFNNGITSAGISCTASRARKWTLECGEPAWEKILQEIPSLAEQFRAAKAVTPFQHHPRLAFRSSCWAAEPWMQLPSAAGFIDPLLSTGFPLTLFGVSRFASALEEDWGTARFPERIRNDSLENEEEFLATEHLVAALYSQMHDFPVFRALTLLYFAAASYSECSRRLGSIVEKGFLLRRDVQFKRASEQACSKAIAGIPRAERSQFIDNVVAAIEPINIAGLGRIERHHWYPATLEDMLEGAGKLGVDRLQVNRMWKRLLD